jgi:hypothetical protein
MKATTALLTLCSSLVLITACKKDDAQATPGPAPAASVANPLIQVFAQHVTSATQQFTVSASTGGSVNGQDGTFIAFGANAFRHADGSMVSGSVQIELIEALGVGDMIWLNKQTLGNNNGQLRPLVSGGQFYLMASQNDVELKLAPGATQVYVPTNAFVDPNMAVFSGTEDADGVVVWDPWANNPINAQDSSGYNFPNDSLGWVNCDYFMSPGAAQSVVQVTCPTGHDHDNTFVWLVFPAQNSMTGVMGGSSNAFSTGPYYQLPIGMNITVVALSNINGAYASSFTNSVVTANMDLDLTFQPTTLAQFQSDAAAL